MKSRGLASLIFPILLAGCGGGSGGSTSMPVPKTTSYQYVAPAVKSQRDYSQVVVDNSNNTINETITQTVTAVNADGSYVYTSEDPTHNSVTVNGTTYSIPTEMVNVNNSGQDSSYSFVASNGSTVTCTYNPHGNGPNYPLAVGNTWSEQYTLTCGSAAAIMFSQSGTVTDLESVTVPAGTFQALRLDSTVMWTTAGGTTITQSLTTWRDVVTQLTVKRTVSSAYSGTLPTNGYAMSTTLELQSSTN